MATSAELLDVLGIDAPTSVDRRKRPPRESATRLRAASTSRQDAPAAGLRVQGNWKRRSGVATRYELALAIDGLLERGRIAIDAGRLRYVGGGRVERTTPEERWARQDAELESYCQRIECHETRSAAGREYATTASGSTFDGVMRSAPRLGVGTYVLRELRLDVRTSPTHLHAVACDGSAEYAAVVSVIYEHGGAYWHTEDVYEVIERVRRKARGK